MKLWFPSNNSINLFPIFTKFGGLIVLKYRSSSNIGFVGQKVECKGSLNIQKTLFNVKLWFPSNNSKNLCPIFIRFGMLLESIKIRVKFKYWVCMSKVQRSRLIKYAENPVIYAKLFKNMVSD